MSTTYEFKSSRSWSADPDAAFARALGRTRLSLFLLLFAALQQCLGHHNGDNTWLFTVCDKLLDGARIYADIIETNPPAAFLIYLPSAALARLVHLRVEFVVSVSAFAAALASIYFSGAILSVGGLLARETQIFAANAVIFALIVLPGFSFAEREHIAAIAILPPLALYAVRTAGGRVQFAHVIGAGLLAGLVVAIKPHFALALALALAAVLWRQQSLKPAFRSESFIAAGVVLAYIAVVVVWFPAFFDVLPTLIDVYVPVKEPISVLLMHPWFLVNVTLLASMLLIARVRCLEPCVLVLIAASFGFLGAFILQSKGWVNHGLPGIALTSIALALVAGPALFELAARNIGAQWREMRRMVMFIMAPAALGLPVLFGSVEQFKQSEEYPGVAEAVRRLAPAHPKLMALSPDLDMGHPLTRRLDGVWVAQPHSLWLMFCSQLLIDAKRGDRAKLQGYIERDAAMFAANVRDGAPDIIIVSKGRRVGMIEAHPLVASAMSAYAPVDKIDTIELWAPLSRAAALH